jgi:hypothetical protein
LVCAVDAIRDLLSRHPALPHGEERGNAARLEPSAPLAILLGASLNATLLSRN